MIKARQSWTLLVEIGGQSDSGGKCPLCGEAYPRVTTFNLSEQGPSQTLDYVAVGHPKCLLPWAINWFGKVVIVGAEPE